MNLEKWHLDTFLKTSECRENFHICHPRNVLPKIRDDEYYKSLETFKPIAKNFQAESKLRKQLKVIKHSRNDNCVVMIATELGLSGASPHTRILKGLAQEIREAIGVKIIYIDTNESNKFNDGPAKKRIHEDDGCFDETWKLGGDLALKWETLLDIILNVDPILIVTLGGMYESHLSSPVATLYGIKSLLYQTNGTAKPINNYDKIYGFNTNGDRRSLPLSDIRIAKNAVKTCQPIENEKLQISTAMRLMDSKLKLTSPVLSLITNHLIENKDIEWSLMGLKPDGPIATKMKSIERLKILPMTEFDKFAAELYAYDIFYHDPEYTIAGVGTISLAYFLGLVVVVTHKNDVWGLISEDDGCHTGDDMDRMLEIEIARMSNMSSEKRLEEKLKRVENRLAMFDKRRLEHIQWLKLMLEDLIETEV